MGAASNESKQRWNREHYALLKAYVSREIAEAFKSRCHDEGASVSGKLGELVAGYLSDGRKPKESDSVSYAVKTRAMRRKAIAAAVGMIEAVLEAETEYMGNIPDNLQNSQVYEAAEETAAALEEALCILGEAYQ